LSGLSDTTSGNPCPGLSWSYDAWGNRTAQTVTSGSCGSSSLGYNSLNHITNSGLQYDAAGNLINDGTHSYTYDAENRITAVGGGSTASYVYNSHGERVLKTAGGVTTEYYHDLSGNVLGEAQGTTVTTGYVYLNQQLLAEYTGGTTYFVHQDHLGSTRLMTNVSGCVVDSLDYLPFGERNSVGSTSCTSVDTTHKFTGKERDSESGLDNFGARYNSSQYGRFMTPDWASHPEAVPYADLSNPQSLNLYSYVKNNPLTYADPDGHIDCSGENANGAGCQYIAQWNKDHGISPSAKSSDAPGVPVRLPNGSNVPDSHSPTGLMMAPTSDVSDAAAAGKKTKKDVEALLAYGETSVAGGTAVGAFGANVATGGKFDYQRVGPQSDVLTGLILVLLSSSELATRLVKVLFEFLLIQSECKLSGGRES
jgi:RHS repeat-associated protein